MRFIDVFLLAIVQGVAELLPVSSSAHVIATEKLLGLDPTSPQMTFLLVMLHTGTMISVICYFWNGCKQRYLSSARVFWCNAKLIAVATAMTAAVGSTLIVLVERLVLVRSGGAEIEQLFGNMHVIAAGLAAAGVLILVSGRQRTTNPARAMTWQQSALIGGVQGLCLPFRGFSRSGATISTALIVGIDRVQAEEFSFALAVVLTPAVMLKEGYRLLKAPAGNVGSVDWVAILTPGLLGMVLSFTTGWLALRWLSRWLAQGRWRLFGYYCLAASVLILLLER